MFSIGFSNIAYLIALVFSSVKILPKTHPFLRPENQGRYTIQQAISETSKHLVVSTKNMDQMIIFSAILIGLALITLQFFFLLIAFMISPAMAFPANFGNFFTLQNPETDLAYRMMDLVFGVPGIFGSQEQTQTAFHQALWRFLQIYSTAMLVVAAMIIAYFVFVVIAETAETGTPFGKRFDHVWAPIRIVLALGLLIPISLGLNSAQYIVLYAAKFGSAFATNGWLLFTETISSGDAQSGQTPVGGTDSLIAKPQAPDDAGVLAEFFTIVHTCKQAYKLIKDEEIEGYVVRTPSAGGSSSLPLNSSTDFQRARQFAANLKFNDEEIGSKDIILRFGIKNIERYRTQLGNVEPYCGEMVVPVTSAGVPGADKITELYYNLVLKHWNDYIVPGTASNAPPPVQGFSIFPPNPANQNFNNAGFKYFTKVGYYFVLKYSTKIDKVLKQQQMEEPMTQAEKAAVLADIQEDIEEAIEEGVRVQRESMEGYTLPQELIECGWGCGGVFYNLIASENGALTAAALAFPRSSKFPSVMEEVLRKKKEKNVRLDPKTLFDTQLADGQKIDMDDVSKDINGVLYEVYKFWATDGYDTGTGQNTQTGNRLIDLINSILGTQGLFDMCSNTDIHPLAQLSAVGRGLVESSVRQFGYALGTGVSGAIASSFGLENLGGAFSAASGFYSSMAGIGLIVGFILFYLIPFLPFIYFFFAVGGWVKGIFEAMVGVPLWALAHLRIDGDGLPGSAAADGYFLIFEIFLRPILILFGLLASVSIYSASVQVLNEIFFLVVSNLAGFNPETTTLCGKSGPLAPQVGSIQFFRSSIDEFFFTVLYAIIVYMMGMSSFKLIDLIPNQILRWMGQSLKTFSDIAEDPAENIVQNVSVGGAFTAQKLQAAVQQGGSAISGAGKGLVKVAQGMGGGGK